MFDILPKKSNQNYNVNQSTSVIMIETLEKTIYIIMRIAAFICVLIGMYVVIKLAIKMLRNE